MITCISLLFALSFFWVGWGVGSLYIYIYIYIQVAIVCNTYGKEWENETALYRQWFVIEVSFKVGLAGSQDCKWYKLKLYRNRNTLLLQQFEDYVIELPCEKGWRKLK